MNSSTLKKINKYIKDNNLDKARDSLHGLLNTYPDDLSLRYRLAEIYLELKQPIMAGRYFFLKENPSNKEKELIDQFLSNTNNNPLQILRELKFKGDILEISEYARNKLLTLQEKSKKKYKYYPDFSSKNNTQNRVYSIDNIFAKWGCIITLIAILILSAIGLMTVINLIF